LSLDSLRAVCGALKLAIYTLHMAYLGFNALASVCVNKQINRRARIYSTKPSQYEGAQREAAHTKKRKSPAARDKSRSMMISSSHKMELE
jgi:hypothetical protein